MADVEPNASPAPGDMEAVLAHVYGVALDQFLPERTLAAAQAKQAGDSGAATQIKGLRKPTVAAWAINHLVRRRPEAARDLLSLADRLRSAHTRLDAAALRELRGEREAMLAAFVAAAAEEAQEVGQRLSPAVRDDIHATAVAVLADFDAGQALATGTLTRALHYSGFGEVDIADAVASTSTGVKLAVLQGGRADQGSQAEPGPTTSGAVQPSQPGEDAMRARRERQRAEQREAARQVLAQARRRVSELARELAEANDELAQAEAALAELDD